MLIYPGKNVIIFFWFLPTIFLISVFSCFLWKFILQKLDLKYWIICLLIFFCISFFNPFENIKLLNISGVAHYFSLFLIGMAFYKYETEICNFFARKATFKLILFLGVHLLIVYLFINHPDYTKIIIPVSLLGIAESIILGNLYLSFSFTFLNHLNKSTYAIYLLSWFPQVFIQFIILKYISVPWYCSAIVSTLFGIYIPFLVFLLVNYIKKLNRFGQVVSIVRGN